VEMQPSGTAVQEHSARLRQAAVGTIGAAALEQPAVDKVLGAS